MDYIIDRFEGEFAVCENAETEKYQNIKKDLIKDKVCEGDIITLKNKFYYFNKEKTEERRKLISEKFNSLWD